MLKKDNCLGLVVGSGKLPLMILEYCEQNNIDVCCILLKGFAKKENFEGKNIVELPIGHIGSMFSFFKKNNVKEIVFAGGVKKPSLSFWNIDFTGFKLLRRILKNKILGDNTILETIIKFCEENSFTVGNVNKYLDKGKFIEGFNSNTTFKDKNIYDDINLGVEFLRAMSQFDIGQSVIVQQKNIIGVECVEGTAELIKRCNNIKYRSGRGAILVKIKKIGQTEKIDLPSIGPDTVEQLHQNGMIGIAFDYKNCIIIDKEKVIELANRYKIFLYGVRVNN